MNFSLRLCVIILVCGLAAQSINGQADDTKPADHSKPCGILSFLLKPFKATFNQAKKLLGMPTPGDAKDFIMDGMQSFRLFMQAHNRTYNSPEEVRRRMGLFLERRKMIEQSVRDFTEGRIPFIMRENDYTDWDESELRTLAMAVPPKTYQEMTDDEREAIMKGDNKQNRLEMREDQPNGEPQDTISLDGTDSSPPGGDESLIVKASRYGLYLDDQDDLDTNLGDDESMEFNGAANHLDTDEGNMTVMAPDRIPASKDWRESGCVAEPINQQKCGACYAIATMNTLETMRCINKETAPILSPQQVIDCSTPRAGYQNHGCDGGWPTRVLKYLQDVRVVSRETCYPFVLRQQSCQMRRVRASEGCTLSASPTGTVLRYRVLDNEDDILYHVAKTGPVITVMQALDSFLFYSRGIYDDKKCSRRRDDVDHAIAIVGYGRENGMDYWLIKNSWGTTDWGEGGYGKFRRGTRACSIGSWGWVITS